MMEYLISTAKSGRAADRVSECGCLALDVLGPGRESLCSDLHSCCTCREREGRAVGGGTQAAHTRELGTVFGIVDYCVPRPCCNMPTMPTCPATLSGRTHQLAWSPCGLFGPVRRVGFCIVINITEANIIPPPVVAIAVSIQATLTA